MKEKLDAFLNKLMDIIIPSLMLAVGLVTIIGFFYSIILAFRYVKKGFKEFQFFYKKHFWTSILLEGIFIAFLAVVFLNFYLFPSYSPMIQLFIFTSLLFFGVALTGITFASLWLLSETGEVDLKRLFSKSINLFYLSIPYWLAYLFFLLLTGILSVMYPALLIFTLGMNIRVTNTLFRHTHKKFSFPLK